MTNFLKSVAMMGLLCASMTAASSEHADMAARNELKAAMEKMHASLTNMQMMESPFQADHDFAMMMIPHHQAAIDMAKVELKYGHDPKLRKMAQKIIKDQQKEISEMKAWQKANPHPHASSAPHSH